MLPPLATTLQTSRAPEPLTDKAPSSKPSIEVIAGITVGSALFVFITVNSIIWCGRCFKKRHQEGYANQESHAENSSNSRPTDIPADEVTESPNDNSHVNSGEEHVYAALRMDKRKQGKLVHFLLKRNSTKKRSSFHMALFMKWEEWVNFKIK
ncbi:uncharacterized protein [Montipora foliosa]|uniref:uncharacterized protein n=1 Tax=Montipora foliosa TaxID=591990 RepID=UPI0035F20B1E